MATRGHESRVTYRRQACFSCRHEQRRGYMVIRMLPMEKIVEYCIQVDLFNAELYTKYHILTSAEIRQQYNNAGFFMAANS
jgi:hypothetical protein